MALFNVYSLDWLLDRLIFFPLHLPSAGPNSKTIHLLFNLTALIHSCCLLGIQSSTAGRQAGLGKASLHQHEFSPSCAFESHYRRSKVVRAQSQSKRQVLRGTEPCCLDDGKRSVPWLSPGSRICSHSSWCCVVLSKEKTSCCAVANGRELYAHFQKKQMLCGKKLDLDPLNGFAGALGTVLPFSVTAYRDCGEITDVNRGTMPIPCLVQAPAVQQRSRGEGKASGRWSAQSSGSQDRGLRNCSSSSWLGRVWGRGQRQHRGRQKGKVPKVLL